MRGATPLMMVSAIFSRFQSTRPMRGATVTREQLVRALYISIHAPHAGRDEGFRPRRNLTDISIHAPHAGRDRFDAASVLYSRYFNPRAPCGARLLLRAQHGRGLVISIHAPHAGRDSKHAQKVPYTFAITDKRNAFSRQTPSVRAFDRELRGGFHYKTRCEPPWKSLRASSSHYTIRVSSGR